MKEGNAKDKELNELLDKIVGMTDLFEQNLA